MSRARQIKSPGVEFCRTCSNEITVAEMTRAIRISARGFVHGKCYSTMRDQITAKINAALAAGTHTLDHRRTCARCRKLTEIYSGALQGRDEYCFRCWIEMNGLTDLNDHQLTRLASNLDPSPFPEDPKFPLRCAAALEVRARQRKAAREFWEGWTDTRRHR